MAPTEVPKESVPEGITKKWNALKATILRPLEDMRHGPREDHEAPHQAFQSNASHDAPRLNGTAPAILDSTSLDDEDDIESEGKIFRGAVVDGKLKFYIMSNSV